MEKPTPNIAFPVAREGRTLFDWLYANLRQGILEGLHPPGTRLPSTRQVAALAGVSRGVVVAVFDQLRAEGYLEAETGSGTWVAATVPDAHFASPGAQGEAPVRSATVPPLRRWSARASASFGIDRFDASPLRAFRANRPALDLFPTTLWARVASRRLRLSTSRLLSGGDPQGHEPLRRAIAAYLNASRGVRCVPGQVVIVSGVQAALDLTARLLLDPGDTVAIETPGYPGARQILASWQARVHEVLLDDEGPVWSNLPDDARLVYTTPAHQFPVGTTMSLTRRLELVSWARRTGGLVFEDDYDGEFRYSGRPIPAVQGLDPDRVVFAGSFSKVLFPSLRLGYLVVPLDLVERFTALQSITQRHQGVPDQAVLADFIEQGHFGRHLRAMREVYAHRLEVLTQAVEARLGGLFELSRVEAGLQTAAWLAPGWSAEALALAARARQVELTPLSRFGRITREGFLLGFSALDDDELRRGVGELARLLVD